MFVSFDRNLTVAANKTGTANSSGEPQFTSGLCGSCCSIFSLLCSFCKSWLVLLVIILSVLPVSEYPLCILKHFLISTVNIIFKISHLINLNVTLIT